MRRALAALVLLAARPLEAAPTRWHFDFGKWRVSIHFEREEKRGDTTRLLVAAPRGRFIFLSKQDPSWRDSTESIQSLRDGETFTRRLVLSSFEEIPRCSSIRAPDACVVFTGSRGTFAAGISAFAGARAPETRAKAAALVSPGMRDALLELAPILPALMEFTSYTSDFLGLVWPERFDRPRALVRGVRGPACAFDATFGYPCTDEERAHEAKRFAAN